MSHPAILNKSTSIETVATKYKHTGNPTQRVRNYPVVRELRYRSEPASVSNPIRKDGTRRPSAYSIDRTYFASRSTPTENRPPPGYWGLYNGDGVSQCDPWYGLVGSGTLNEASVHASFHPAAFTTSVIQRAQVEFLNKLADASGKDSWALGVVAGEFRETCGMTADLAGRLTGAARSIARGVRKSPTLVANVLRSYGELGPKAALRQLGGQNTALLETIVQGWLVKQFGIDPLVSDLFNASVQLQAKLVDPVEGAETFTTVIRGGASDTREWSKGYALASINGNEGSDARIDLRTECKVSFACKYQIPVKPTVNQRLGLYNPVLLTAQLTRFSWMADYVTNLSDWLRAMMAGQDCKFIEGTRSVLSRTTGNGGEAVARPGWSILSDPISSRGYVLSSDQFKRTLVPVTGVLPAFLPAVKNQLNVTKMANSVAALTTLVGARSRPGPPVIKY